MTDRDLEQKPVFWMVLGDGDFGEYSPGMHFSGATGRDYWERRGYELQPLYTHPAPEPVIDKSAAIRIATALGWEPKRDWVGLLWGELPKNDVNHDFLRGAEWAEAKLREKNT